MWIELCKSILLNPDKVCPQTTFPFTKKRRDPGSQMTWLCSPASLYAARVRTRVSGSQSGGIFPTSFLDAWVFLGFLLHFPLGAGKRRTLGISPVFQGDDCQRFLKTNISLDSSNGGFSMYSHNLMVQLQRNPSLWKHIFSKFGPCLAHQCSLWHFS